MAREKGLDLMEVSPNAQPPVCKICDYGKFKYEKKKKDQVAKKKQTVIKVKEIQLRPQTEEHDLDYKFKNAVTFLEEGAKVKVTIMFRGREIAYAEQGHKMMRDLAEKVKDVASVEATPKLEGKKLIMILTPLPPGKKGASPPPRVIIIPRAAVTPNGGPITPKPMITPNIRPNPPAVAPLPTPKAAEKASEDA